MMEALLNECKLFGVEVSLPTQMPPPGSLEEINCQLRVERLLLSRKLEVKEEELLNVKAKLVEVTKVLDRREEEIQILKRKKKPISTEAGATGKAEDVKEVEVSGGRNEIFVLCPNGNGDASSEGLKMESSGSCGPIRWNDNRIPSVIVPLMDSTRGIQAAFSLMECDDLASQTSSSTMVDIKNKDSRNSCEAEIGKKDGTQQVVVVDLVEEDPVFLGVGTDASEVTLQDTDDPDDTKSHGSDTSEQHDLKPVIPQNKRFWCHECRMEWFTEEGLTEHQIAAHEKLLFKCSICNLGFPNFNARNLHAKIHDAEKDKTCKESAAGTVASEVVKSASPPTSGTPETKPVCDPSVPPRFYWIQTSRHDAGYYTPQAPSFKNPFLAKNLRERTVRKSLKPKLFQSEMPNFCPPNKNTRELAPQEKSEQKNSEGFKKELSTGDTKDKSLNTTTDTTARTISTRQKKPFQSDSDRTKSSSPPKKTRGLDQDDESKQLTCEDCGRKFQTKWNLNRHIDRIHPKKKDDMKMWACDVCGKDLGSEDNLESHRASGCAPQRKGNGAEIRNAKKVTQK